MSIPTLRHNKLSKDKLDYSTNNVEKFWEGKNLTFRLGFISILNLSLIIYITVLNTLKVNTKSTKDQPQMETCSYLSCLLRQDKDYSVTEKYMLGTVYLWTLETT